MKAAVAPMPEITSGIPSSLRISKAAKVVLRMTKRLNTTTPISRTVHLWSGRGPTLILLRIFCLACSIFMLTAHRTDLGVRDHSFDGAGAMSPGR
jgi:hypothetical protein